MLTFDINSILLYYISNCNTIIFLLYLLDFLLSEVIIVILPEIVEVGFFNSQVVNKNVKISKSRKTTTFEIELSTEAGGTLYIDGASTPITPNMLICAKPDQTRHSRFPYKCYYVHITVNSGDIYDILMNVSTFFETDKLDVYKDIFVKLVKHYNSFDRNKEIILQSLLLKLIYTINNDFSLKSKNGNLSSNRLTVEHTLTYINEHLTENLTLEKIAREMSFSPIYFHNTFKSTVGKTLRNYIEEERIKKASNLLITTNCSLTQIAYECGFSSQSYFSYVFKRRMKMTPREYVKEINKRYEI